MIQKKDDPKKKIEDVDKKIHNTSGIVKKIYNSTKNRVIEGMRTTNYYCCPQYKNHRDCKQNT